MKSDLEEKLAEILIGEAVTELLDACAAISWHALLERLHIKVNTATDEAHVLAGMRAISDIRREMQSRSGGKNETTSDAEPVSLREKMH